ncbi:MAG: OmpA family protein [Planctomycetes bacterium]|nr:OmpA family protein [Planctomycetota bacterium]
MRRYLTVLLGFVTLSTVVVACTGCVDTARLRAANETMKRERDKAQEAARDGARENEKLLADARRLQQELDTRKRQVDLLTAETARNKADFDELATRYKMLTEAEGSPQFNVLPIKVDRALRGFAQANPDLVEYLPNYGMVKLRSDLSFASGATQIQVRPSTTQALDKLVEILKSTAASKLGVYIAGHTDNVPIGKPETRKRHPDNWYLSVHRAIAVRRALERAGLAPERMAVMGFGEYHPVKPNKVSKSGKKLGNAANRRVEIWIVPANRFLTRTDSAIATK